LLSGTRVPEWENIGGQLIRTTEIEKLRKQIKSGKIKSWEDIHAFYVRQAANYPAEKLAHALAAWRKVSGFSLTKVGPEGFKAFLQKSVKIRKWMVDNIYSSREKD